VVAVLELSNESLWSKMLVRFLKEEIHAHGTDDDPSDLPGQPGECLHWETAEEQARNKQKRRLQRRSIESGEQRRSGTSVKS
jgi:hypothetical protein